LGDYRGSFRRGNSGGIRGGGIPRELPGRGNFLDPVPTPVSRSEAFQGFISVIQERGKTTWSGAL